MNLIAYTSKATHGHCRQITVALGMVPESPSHKLSRLKTYFGKLIYPNPCEDMTVLNMFYLAACVCNEDERGRGVSLTVYGLTLTASRCTLDSGHSEQTLQLPQTPSNCLSKSFSVDAQLP